MRGGGTCRTEEGRESNKLFQAKTHGGDFSLIPPRDEKVRVISRLE